MIKKDLIIIGGGSAGLAAAISAYDNGVRDILILERDRYLGGILNQCIHNGFGLQIFHEQLSGPEYAHRFIKEVNDRHIAYKLQTTVLSIDKERVVTYCNIDDGLVQIAAKAIVFAIGCYERNAGAIKLPGKRLNGIYTAGTVQKYLNIDGYLVGKKVFILGSGDIGLIMARRMHLEGAQVLGVAEIMPYSNGLNRNIVQCLHDFNIPLYLSHTIKNIEGQKEVEKVTIVQVDEHQQYIENTEKSFACDTVLLSVGLIPSSDLLKEAGAEVSLITKSVLVKDNMETSIPGIFACGNVLHVHDLVDYVTEESYLAGLGAANYILNRDKKTESLIKVESRTNVQYIVPHFIRYSFNCDTVNFKLRVKKPLENVYLIIKADDVVIKKIKKPFLLPSEMVQLCLDSSFIPENTKLITIEVGDDL